MKDGSCSKCGAHWSEPCWCEENEKVDKFKKLEQELAKLKDENERLGDLVAKAIVRGFIIKEEALGE